ncbi:MAG: nickel pincer cofactor biosynthesis protein LarC [Eubacteriales bacterium]|nr:nickel pincer cofactor biosynthesis protein LarC [Eubacteriales bacterium]
MTKKILYLECNMGAAGDMLTAALLELLPDKNAFLAKLRSIIPVGVEIDCLPAQKAGIWGSQMSVRINGNEEMSQDVALGRADHAKADHSHHDHDHSHSHDHHDHDHRDHNHNHAGHSHNSYADIREILAKMDLPDKVRQDASAVYQLIADAESKAHGVSVDEVHFHEVGMLDAVVDVVAVCYLIHELKPDKILASPIHLGSGQVRCAHGILPVPVPAVAHILRGVPTYQGEIKGELCTPTGAALLRHFVEGYGPMPVLAIKQVGYGLGHKDFPVANLVRAFWGTETGEETTDRFSDQVVEIKATLDDMTGEDLAFAAQKLLAAGALDVYYQSIYSKKSRPAYELICLAKPQEAKALAEKVLQETSTFGVRFSTWERLILERESVSEKLGESPVSVKHGSYHNDKSGLYIHKAKPEYEDLAKLAENEDQPLYQMRQARNWQKD